MKNNPYVVSLMTSLPSPDAAKEEGYDKWLAEEISAGIADIRAGRITPAKDVWKELGLE